ncbi:hypothetical protein J437_LFUL000918 [Ladona fulva]|uniref:C2H2-type domain-containing protein n=1 Tax=Ladona fulva TaxID=123851 RepID=A0A8K0K6S8_LADFU|nr:hypothetical protein J437_LFUL000918 [Ladona fulva]
MDIEECPQPSASPVAAKKPRTQTVLQEYYYGRIKGKSKEDLDREEVEWRANPANSSVVEFQCCVCQRMFTNNLLFMRHLMKHTQNKGNVDLTDETPVCKYCLRTFQSSPMLERHVKEDHIVKKGQLTCRICNIIFFSTLKLTEHMHNTHVELELPYSCKICGYRSSMHRDVVDHFHEFHDGSRKLQCPFCLQVVTLSGRGKHSLHNVFLFFQHIQASVKHFIQPRSIKCDKCILRFVTKSNIQEHAARDHLSCKGKPGLTRLQFKGESIIMPVPDSPSQQSTSPVLATKSLPVELPPIRLPQVNSGVNGKVKPRSKPSMLNNVGISPMMGLPQEEVKVRRVDFAVSSKCCECKGDIYQERHFL